MNRYFVGALLSVALAWTPAAGGERADFALFDGTNPVNQGQAGVTNPVLSGPPGFAGAVCGLVNPPTAPTGKETKFKGFTVHFAVTNDISGDAGFVRLTYKDLDIVQFPIASGGSFSFAHTGDNEPGTVPGPPGPDQFIRISGFPGPTTTTVGVRLVGVASIVGGREKVPTSTTNPPADVRPFCLSCDNDAACDAIVPDGL